MSPGEEQLSVNARSLLQVLQGEQLGHAGQESGRVVPFDHVSKQIGWLVEKVNAHLKAVALNEGKDQEKAAQVKWKHTGLRHSFISYRVAEIGINEFPSPEDLWQRYCTWKGLTPKQTAVVAQDYCLQGADKEPRYYQEIAINRIIEAIAKGENRVLLTMATGMGKTFVAFQIIWRLWKAGVKKRILFLADRNILVDQTRVNDFKPFGSKMTKIEGRKIDKSCEIYMALYQGVTGNDEAANAYKEFSPDFFDLVIVDECYRGSADEDSNWRKILEYFKGAPQKCARKNTATRRPSFASVTINCQLSPRNTSASSGTAFP